MVAWELAARARRLGLTTIEGSSPLQDRILELAKEIGAQQFETPGFRLERCVALIETIDSMVCPTAADLCHGGESVNRALALVDERALTLRRLLDRG